MNITQVCYLNTQKISKDDLIDNIKNFNNIKIYERYINDIALKQFLTNKLIFF